MDKIIHGLDLPDNISENNNKIIMAELGITEEDILNGIESITDDEENEESTCG